MIFQRKIQFRVILHAGLRTKFRKCSSSRIIIVFNMIHHLKKYEFQMLILKWNLVDILSCYIRMINNLVLLLTELFIILKALCDEMN